MPRWGAPQDAFKGLLSGKPSQPPYQILLSNYPGHGGEPTCNEATRDCFNPAGGGIGLNHDSVPRRNSLTSLLMAQEATSDLVDRVKELVNDASLWQAVIDTPRMAKRGGRVGSGERPLSCVGPVGLSAPAEYHSNRPRHARHGLLCDCATWVNGWQKTLADLFVAAPPGFATGGGAPRFPPMSTPIFELPFTPIGDTGAFAGTYSVSWGDKTGTFELGTAPPSQPYEAR